jgi:hypothetical protein
VISEAAAAILSTLPVGAAEPARGAETTQVAVATAGAALGSTALLGLAMGHRAGRIQILDRAAAAAARATGLPGWAALPAALAAVALIVALLGMYWDISLHIDNGRDAGPLANPAHYLILAGLFGVFTAGVLAIVLPKERPGPGAVRIARGWYAPVGGVLMAACGAFSLIAFPLDDLWHRLFGQDVTLWGPTHLMLIGGAGLSLVGQSVLVAEGLRARAPTARAATPPARRFQLRPEHVTAARRLGLMGGLLVGLSTFQAEFDFGVPQYRLVFQPMLIALAAGAALVTARLWIGRGGALGAALFFLGLRGAVSLLVGPVFGQTTPSLPLYLGEALCVELLALVLARRPLVLGAASGVAIGTAGLATEWGWSQLVMRLPWTGDLLPEAIVFAVAAGVAGGIAGALLAVGLRGKLPRPVVARTAIVLATALVGVIVAAGLVTNEPRGARVAVALASLQGGDNRSAHATVRVEPRSLAGDPAWVTVTAWQGGGLHVDRLERIAPGVFRTTQPIPLHGSWKSLVRVHAGNAVLGAPIHMAADLAIPAAEIPATARFTRPLQRDTEVLQRERDFDVPTWLWGGATALVVALYLALLATLSWGVGRIGRTGSATVTAQRRRVRSSQFAVRRPRDKALRNSVTP